MQPFVSSFIKISLNASVLLFTSIDEAWVMRKQTDVDIMPAILQLSLR